MNDNDAEIHVGGKWPVKLKGIVAMLMALIGIMAAAIIWLVHFSLGSWGEPFNIQQTIVQHAESVHQQHDEGAYILTVCLNPSRRQECEQLNLTMPDSLRKKQRRD